MNKQVADCKVSHSQHSPSSLAVRQAMTLETLHCTELLVHLFVEGFRQWVGDLVCSVTALKLDFSILSALAYEVILDVDVFGPLVDRRIQGEILGTIVVDPYADSVGFRLLL